MTTSAEHRNRQPKGVSTGGQFAPGHKAEPTASLGLSLAPEPLDTSTAQAALELSEQQPHGTSIVLGPDGVDVETLSGNSFELRRDRHLPGWVTREPWTQSELRGTDANELIARADASAHLNEDLGETPIGGGLVSRLVVDQTAENAGWGLDYAVWADVDVPGLDDDDPDITTVFTVAVHPVTGQVLEVTDSESGSTATDAPQETMQAVGDEVALSLTRLANSDALTVQGQQMIRGIAAPAD